MSEKAVTKQQAAPKLRKDMTKWEWTLREMKVNKVGYVMVAPYYIVFLCQSVGAIHHGRVSTVGVIDDGGFVAKSCCIAHHHIVGHHHVSVCGCECNGAFDVLDCAIAHAVRGGCVAHVEVGKGPVKINDVALLHGFCHPS